MLRKLSELFGLILSHDLDIPHAPSDMDALRGKLATLRELLIDVVVVIDDMDPTGRGLADAQDEAITEQLGALTYLDEHRK